jgi:hypothetical protein
MENLNLFLSILSGLVMGIVANILTPYATKILAVCRRSKHLNNLESSMELKWLLIRTN